MYLDFAKISQEVKFRDLLDRLEIEYRDIGKELFGEFPSGKRFVVNTEKNLFMCPTDKNAKGSVINFVSYLKDVGLRDAAKWLITDDEVKKIPKLELKYSPLLRKAGITEETAKCYGIGVPSGKSVVSGSVAFKVLDLKNNVVGYVGVKEGKIIVPKSLRGKEKFYKVPSAFFTYISQLDKICKEEQS